jgi:hypothetical protein
MAGRKPENSQGWLQLFHLFYHEHFHRLAAGKQFEAELVEQDLFQAVRIAEGAMLSGIP